VNKRGALPFFGTLFVALFLVVQVGLCFWFRSKPGLAWIAGAFVVGLIAGSIYESTWRTATTPVDNPAMARVLKEHHIITIDYNWTRHKLVTGACLSAVAFGLGLTTNRI